MNNLFTLKKKLIPIEKKKTAAFHNVAVFCFHIPRCRTPAFRTDSFLYIKKCRRAVRTQKYGPRGGSLPYGRGISRIRAGGKGVHDGQV